MREVATRTLLLGQVLTERYERTVIDAVLLTCGILILFRILGYIFQWIGAEFPTGQ